MKIAMLTNNYRPFVGGVPISVERQAVGLAKRGNDVTVFAPAYEETKDAAKEQLHEEECRGRLHVVRFSTGKQCLENGMAIPKLAPREILPVFEEEWFDLIHTHHPMFVGPMALYLGKKYDLPVVYTYHTRYEDYLHYLPLFQGQKNGIFRENIYRAAKEKLVPGYMRWFTNQCNLVLAPSAGIQKQIREQGTKVPIAVFPTGLEEGFYRDFAKEAKEIRRRFLPEGGVLFCTTGRLEKSGISISRNPTIEREDVSDISGTGNRNREYAGGTERKGKAVKNSEGDMLFGKCAQYGTKSISAGQ